MENVCLFLNLANDPTIERIITPRSAEGFGSESSLIRIIFWPLFVESIALLPKMRTCNLIKRSWIKLSLKKIPNPDPTPDPT